MIRSLPGKTGYIQHLIYHVMQPANEPDRAEERTPGIKVCDMVIRDRGSGEADEVASLRVYDFGGQLAYHVIHTLMMSDRLAAFVVCVDLSQREQHVKERANYWLQFICTRLQQGMAAAANSIGAAPMTEVKPRVIIVGTKKDLAYKNNLVDADGHPTWGKAMMADLQDTFGHIIDIHSTLIRFTCFLDKGRNFNALRLELVRHWRWLKDRQLEVPKVVSEVAAILKTAQLECPLWKVGDLLERVHKSSEHEFAVTAALPENIFHLTLRYLHARGDLLWYYKLPSLADVVFLSPNWLLHDVMGKALQPKGVACGGLRPKRGVVSFSDISAAFEGIASPELVISILQHALLCFELPQNERGRRRFMLPSRVEEDVDVDKEWRQHEDDDDHDNWAVYGGRRLKVTDDALALPPGFFPHVQTRLHSKFRTPPDIWRNAFRCEWRGVQCFGLQRGDREVDVWVRAREGATTHALPCLTKVFSLLQEEARGIDSHHIVLSPKQLRQHVPKPIGYAFDAIHNQPPNEFVESSYHDPGQSALSERVYDLLMLPPERPDSAMPTWQCPGYEWHHPSWRLDDTLDEQLRWSGPNAHRTYTAPLPPNTQLYEWVEKQMAPGMSLSRVEVTKSATMLQLFNGRLAQCASRRASPNSPHFNRTFDYDRDKKRMVEQLKAQFAQTGEDVEHVNVLIAWHGCSVSNIDAMASEGLANLSKPADRGFYGAGIYVTPQAGYAAGYSTRLLPGTWEAPNSRGEHVLLLCAVSIGLAQPITRQADYNEASRCKWFGEPIKDGFDARYVQVLSSDNFQATPTPGTYNFEEIVVSQEAQVLPIAKVFVKVNRDELRDYLASPPPAPAPAP
ncbi:hypothetical protein PTSG_09169 [Salpingoeca rosetta]|uniref:Poly [ADP-ribose] polymerase n=1 Tax=Salpingoeca rosetta (strain ATCC 50818 / BSB-021) TaxID=946362 RepID=F2UMX5_SALR5|nr:uncharacterized protein PTSG_09169 [Salpingoeca rosetta]EGD78474.1 hypothetical protein PTSG_09169 [Salpingoeca rosetta]|eukprot:XP_004989423.1 hypothetical protein PTSG_09169 [Salpingoeca rosetta]